MSLLDDVSIVVTPNGYKAGELYAVIPVPSEGSELLTNGDFASDLTGWTGYGTTSATGGVATIGASSNSGIFQGILTEGVRYTVTVNVTSYDGVGTAQFANSNGSNIYTITETGIQTFIFTHSIASPSMLIRGRFNALFSLSSVSVKEYTSADMDVTRATAATRVDENGLIEDVLSNVPRIDYTGGGCPHILAEPQRTNEITYSEDFSNAIWQKQTGIVPTYNTTETLSPDGTYNATKFIGNGSAGVLKAGISVTGVVARSVYLKSVTGTVNVVLKDPNQTVTSKSLTVTTEWQRFDLTEDNTITLQGIWIDDIPVSGIYMWGAQVEQGSYPTSYIPTSGSTVTRNQDQFSRDGIGSLINSTEGVLFLEIAALSNDSTRRAISLSDGTNTNRVVLRYDNASNRVQGFIQVGGATNGNINDNSYTITNFLKIAYKWKAGDFALWINGTEVATSTDATSFSVGVLTELQFNEGDGAGGEYFGKVKQLQVYKTALTDAQLTSLTS